MRAPYRLALAALCCDLGVYLLMLSLPYRLLDLEASSLVLGLVPLSYAGPYAITALTAGRLSDRWPRRTPIRLGLCLALTGAAALAVTGTRSLIFAGVALIGIGLGFFWPSVQAGISEVESGANLGRYTRLFNMGWSSGKGLGMLAGGLLLPRIGGTGLALCALAAWVACWIALPAMARPGRHDEVVAADARRPAPARVQALLWSAWLGNGIGFAVAATLNHHLPRLLRAEGIGSERLGVFLGLVFLTQTALFYLLGPRRWWQYRALPLVGVQLLLALAVLAVIRPGGPAGLLLLAPVFGATLGFLYQSSLYYSLHAPQGRGGQAGIHEASLGIFSATLPLLGGAMVASAGLAAPFLIAAAGVGASLVMATFWVLRSRPQAMTGAS